MGVSVGVGVCVGVDLVSVCWCVGVSTCFCVFLRVSTCFCVFVCLPNVIFTLLMIMILMICLWQYLHCQHNKNVCERRHYGLLVCDILN